MSYDNNYENGNSMRQKDLVLSQNEFCFLQNKTNGIIKTYTGPIMLTISQQEALVIFDSKSKQFKEVSNFDQAKQLVISAPENWYVILKNPATDGSHPEGGKSVMAPALSIGEKINLRGPVTFSKYPGQMAKVVRGHALRSNQYLLARVYEADAASKSTGEMLDAEGNKIESTGSKYVNGQILVIKGTEVSFYIPPTGIEVIAVDNNPAKGYTREAVTLERLEYCILKDENGNKRYVHGPKVVFPEPTETFVASAKNSYIFRAIELSKISGIYAKVIAEYTDEKEVVHPVGEELFITGDDQMIYYPRPEHAIISYDNKIMHHAIAIPEGEGRYIMNRLTGVINTVKGPKMYLPDPRTEVVVKRKLTPTQCELWFPGNTEALAYNVGLSEKSVEKGLKSFDLDSIAFSCATSDVVTMANLEAKANISRGTSYTKPRTITLDNKFEGVVSLDVWTGYAVNVTSKSGKREVVCGPKTILLDYDQTLEVLQMSTGCPKTTDHLMKTVFLRHENNKVSDIINIETKDFVKASVKVSYCVDFDPKSKDKWFNVENYVKYLCDRERALIKRAAKKYTIEEFYQNYADIVRNIAIDYDPDTKQNKAPNTGRMFPENGMYVHDCEVLSISVEPEIEEILESHQAELVQKSIELSNAEREVKITTALAQAQREKDKIENETALNALVLARAEKLKRLEIQSEMARKEELENQAACEAKKDLQELINAIHTADMSRKKAESDAQIAFEKAQADIEKAKMDAYAKNVKDIMSSISPDLVAALESQSDSAMMEALANAVGPYAIAKGESIAETANTLLRGTTLEKVFQAVEDNQRKG